MVSLNQAMDNPDSSGGIIFGRTKESNLAVGGFAIFIAIMIVEFLVNMELRVYNKKLKKHLKTAHSRKPHKLRPCVKNHIPVSPLFFTEDTVPQFIEAEWNAQLRSGFLPSNFAENALSGFDEFIRLVPDEQIRSTEAWNMDDLVSSARRDFRTNHHDDHQSNRNFSQNQHLKFPTFLTEREKSPNSKPQNDKEEMAISKLVMMYTRNNYNSFNKI
jgi:hypothetical protein